MATAIIRIDRPASTGTNDRSRSDGSAAGETITVSSMGVGEVHTLSMWDHWPPPAGTPGATVSITTPTLVSIAAVAGASASWTFALPAGSFQAFGLKLVVDGIVVKRIIAVPHATSGLIPILYGETGDRAAELPFSSASSIAKTTFNVSGNARGWATRFNEALLFASGISPPFTDSTALVKGSADATKLLRFEVDGFTTGTTRVITAANQNVDMTPNTGTYPAALHASRHESGGADALTLSNIAGNLSSTAADNAVTEARVRTALNALTAAANFNGQNITNVGTVDGVDVSAIVQGHVIEDEGTPVTQRANMNFTGAGVAVADSGGKTVVTIAATATTNGHVIEDEGSAVTQRANMNFTGAGVSVADSGGKTVVTIAGAGSSTPNPVFQTDSGNISNLAYLFAYLPLSEVNGGVYDRLGRVHCTMGGTVVRSFGGGPSTQEMVVADFTGSANYFENADTSDWGFSGANTWSVMCWFRLDTLPASTGDRYVCVSRMRNTGGGWAVGVSNDFGTTYPNFYTNDGGGATIFAGVTSLSINTWYCGVWAWTGTEKHFWLNGADQFGGSGPVPQSPDSTTRFQIGREVSGTPSAFDGRIALVCLWRGVALNGTEATALYGAGTPNRLRGI